MTVIAALVVASISFYLTSEVLLDRIEHTDLTSEERLIVFANVNRGIADNPALGFGYGTFSDSFRLYDNTELPYHYDRAHNTWLEDAFELGLPAALALYLAMAGLGADLLARCKTAATVIGSTRPPVRLPRYWWACTPQWISACSYRPSLSFTPASWALPLHNPLRRWLIEYFGN